MLFFLCECIARAVFVFFSSRRRHTSCGRDWSSDVCSSDVAARDARLKGLLEDLELVLAQIAQLPASGDREDVQSINQGLDQRSVLLRLRTANPAGPGPVRTQGAL